MYIVDKINEIKARFNPNSVLLDKDKRFIESFYERVLSKPFANRGCSDCYNDAFIELYNYASKNEIRDMGQFLLKRQEIIRVTSKDDNGKNTLTVHNRSSLTDEIAIMTLKKAPNMIVLFESYPDNWEDIINQDSKTKSKKATKATEIKEQ